MWIVGCVVGLCSCGAQPEPSAAQFAEVTAGEAGLVAQWAFVDGEKPEGLREAGAPQFGAEGVALSEGAYLVCDDTAAFETPEATWEALFRLDAPAGFAYNPCLLAMRDPQNTTRLSVHISGDYARIMFWNGAGVSSANLVDGPLTPGVWHHVAIADRGAEGIAVYLDGVSRAVHPATGLNRAPHGLPLVIGAANPEGIEALPCTVAGVALYDRAFTEADAARCADAFGFAAYRAEVGPRQIAQDDAAQAEREATQAERRAAAGAKKAAMLADPALTERGEPRIYRGAHLEAISLPIGGIGAGLIQMNGRAEPAIWQMFNNYMNVRIPDSILAIRAQAGQGPAVVRALQTAPAGPFAPMADLTFEGRCPFGWYRFEEPALPVRVELEVFSPFIPMNARDSGIPCAIFNVTVTNPGAEAVEVGLLAAQQNAVGCSGAQAVPGRVHAEYGGNVNAAVQMDAYTGLHMTRTAEGRAAAPTPEQTCCACASGGPGDMTLAALGAATVCTSWTDAEALAEAFAAGAIDAAAGASGPSPEGETLNGAVETAFTLAPGASRTATFVLAWHFPGQAEGAWGGSGVMYTNWYGNSLDVVADVAARYDALSAQTRAYVDALYASNLPHWLIDRLSSQAGILRTRTCYWTRDGYFGGYEGTCRTSGCCPGNCNHVWHYAQAHARLFPEIGRRTREQGLARQTDEGGLAHRHHVPDAHPVCDGQLGDILGAYREHLLSTDGAWLEAHWPAIRKAMAYVINRWDPDEDGLFHGPQFNTLDSELGGATTWMGSLYCAALDACAQMARFQGDSEEAARYDRIRRTAAENQDALLWNGSYYIQVPDEQPYHDYNTGCHIDQLLGEWWARQLGLDWIYPEERAESALAALIEHNFQPDFHGVEQRPRKFVSDPDAGMQMITFPDGRRPLPHTLYADEVMSGFEYSAAAAMVQRGMLREGLMIAKAVADRYDGRLRTGVTDADTAAWGYTGNPFGDDECGKFYARAMSVWSLLLASQGFSYDGPAGEIGFAPVWRPDDHVSFFTVAEGWGVYAQRAGEATLDLRYGRLHLTRWTIQGAPGLAGGTVCVELIDADGAAAPVIWTARADGDALTVDLPDGLDLTAGQTLHVVRSE